MEFTYCVNCSSASGSMVLEDEQIFHCIQQWTSPLSVQPHDLICTTCWNEASRAITSLSSAGRNCALCNTVLPLRTRSHQLIALRTDTQHHVNIRNIIFERLLPLQVRASDYICYPCWQRAERAAKHYSLPSSSRGTAASRVPLRCINCNINLIRMRRRILEDNAILLQVQQQITPRVATSADYICEACHTLISERSATVEDLQDSTLTVGHLNICLICGHSLTNARSHEVLAEINRHVLHIIQNWVQPRQVQPSDLVCHRCYQHAETTLNEARSEVSVPQADIIILPNYSRAPDTHSRCIFPTCTRMSQQMVPLTLRIRLFSDHKYYIPRNCRICSFHLESQTWSDLFEGNMNHSFTAAYIEDF
ncbi:unnamed protein product [Parnassius mnemosyne]|uniref:Uncharacterized protein n=1 Tax=Parnassius mnemosyne TaxID=213953 RepID=A0AAV1LSK2_9NEOP